MQGFSTTKNSMNTLFDIEEFIEAGSLSNELDYERALIADRKLRLLAKEDARYKELRVKLRSLIAAYEKAHWSQACRVDDEQLRRSDLAERLAEEERLFMEERKQRIRKKLKQYDLSQEDLAALLGHKSKTHVSELMNGLKPFTLKDLVIISRLLRIDIRKLVPVFLSFEEQLRIRNTAGRLNKPRVKQLLSGLEAP